MSVKEINYTITDVFCHHEIIREELIRKKFIEIIELKSANQADISPIGGASD